MASIKYIRTTKDGNKTYKIRVRKKGKYYSCNHTVPGTWSYKVAEKELNKVAVEFAEHCDERIEEIKTLKQYCEAIYMPKKALELSEHTRAYYQLMLDSHIYPVIGNYNLDDIRPEQIDLLLASEHKKGVSKSTLHGIYITLGQIFKTAYRKRLTTKNIMELVDMPRYKKTEESKDITPSLDIDSLKLFMQEIQKESLKWQAYMMLLIDSGARKGEILGLRWSNVDFDTNTIHIDNNLCYTPNKGIYNDKPKTKNSIRTFDVSTEVMTLLKRYKKEKKILKINTDDYVFTKDDSTEPLHPSAPYHMCKKISKRLGFKITPHMFRHTFASISIVNGADIASISEKLGHSSKSITLDMYTHADQEAIKAAGNIFRQAIK